MRKQYLFILVVLSFQILVKGQELSYSNMDRAVFAKSMKNESMRVVFNRNLQFLFDAFAGAELDEKKAKKEKEQATLRINMLKKNFELREKFPDSIASGWHAVALTADKDFFKDAKVFVSKNTILRLVIEDCIRIPCTTKGQIKNGTGVITLNDINSEFAALNVYFINDLDSTALIDEPKQPGYVCFWTSKGNFLNERLMINGISRNFIGKLHDKEPECLETGVPFYIMKPGIYKFRVTKTGNDKEESFEVKSGMCLKYRLN